MLQLKEYEKINLLFIEDDEDFRASLIRRLAKRNFKVNSVASAEEALIELGHKKYDVVVSDIKLAGINGIELLSKIREINEALPVILITGYANLNSAKHAVKLKATEYLLKPLGNIEELLNPLYKAVHSYKLLQDNKKLYNSLKEKVKELEISEQKYRDLFDLASDIIFTLDRNGNFATVNKKIEQITKYKKEELVGMPVSMLLSTLEGNSHGAEINEMLLEGKRLGPVEVKLTTKDGHVKIAELGNRPIKDRTGVIGIQCILRDITERKRDELRIKSLKEYYENIVSSIPNAILTINESLKINSANVVFFELFGKSPDDVIERKVGEVFDKFIENKVADAIKTYNSRQSINFEWSMKSKDGELCFVDISLKHTTIGKKDCILMVLTDITELRQAEVEKKKIEFRFLQMQKMEALGKLAGGVAHDFNNILTVIKGHCELAIMKLGESDPIYLNLKQINHASVRGANLAQQMLVFSRRQPMEFALLDLNRKINDLIVMLNRLMSRDISVATELDPSLLSVYCDAGNIDQLLMNLLLNAKDALTNGGTITIKTENVFLDEKSCKEFPEAKEGHYVALTVKDTGIGMSSETLERIFDPYFTMKGIGKGTGLGLSVVYGIVREHNGWIRVSSEIDKGSAFKVYLPAFLQKPQDDIENSKPFAKIKGMGERILVIEDEKEIQEFVKRALTENGYEVYAVSSISEGINIFKNEQGNFDIIFSDIVLPDGSGVDLVEQLLLKRPSLKIVLSSGYYTEQKIKVFELQEKGFRFLQKPYSIIDLFKAIYDVMNPENTFTFDQINKDRQIPPVSRS